MRIIRNFVRWQLLSRALPGPHRIPFVNDTQLWARRGETGITGNIYVGLHEFEDMCFVAHVLRPGDLFVDVGANAGSYSVLASAVAGAVTVAIEPSPEAVERLRANTALNNLGEQLRIETCAVGARDGSVMFTQGLDTVNHVVQAHTIPPTSISVPSRRLDDILATDHPTVIKLDVEGYEWEALEGATSTLSMSTLLAVLVELSAENGGPAATTLGQYGFTPNAYDPFGRRLRASAVSIGVGNTLFTRDADVLAARLASARKLRVLGCEI